MLRAAIDELADDHVEMLKVFLLAIALGLRNCLRTIAVELIRDAVSVTESKVASLFATSAVSVCQVAPPVPVARGKRHGPPTRSVSNVAPNLPVALL